MPHGFSRRALCAAGVAALIVTGCATGPPPTPETWTEATGPAWSYSALPPNLVVDVSPAGDTLRWGGSIGTVVGRGVDVAQNATYRNRIQEALGDYDSAALLEAALADALATSVGPELRRVPRLTSMAGYASRQAAEEVYYGQLARGGVDLLLEVQSRHGVFGPDAIVATQLRATLYALPSRKRLWREVVVISPGPAYAFADLGNPTRTTGIIPRIDLRFGVDSDRIGTLTANGAAQLRADLDETRAMAVAALLVSKGLSDDALGHYALGRAALLRGDFETAHERFERAVALDGTPRARLAFALSLAYLDDLGAAMAATRALLTDHPGFEPAHANLAWWHATETGNLAAAREHREQLTNAPPEVRALLVEAIASAEE